MAEKSLFGFWFCLPVVCFLVQAGLAQIPEPERCLVSGIYNVIRLHENNSIPSCWQDCVAEPDCHLVVVTSPLHGSAQCLLVSCLNQGSLYYHRKPSTEIQVYPKNPEDARRRKWLQEGAYGLAEETFRCHDIMNASYSSCRSGSPRFFYNRTSFRCEQFLSGCGSSSNSFSTPEGCQALCSEQYLCYRPVQYGVPPPLFPHKSSVSALDKPDASSVPNFFFYNMSSSRCEGFFFRGSVSNGNIFRTVEECEALCRDVKDTTLAGPTENTSVLSIIALVVVVAIATHLCRLSKSKLT